MNVCAVIYSGEWSTILYPDGTFQVCLSDDTDAWVADMERLPFQTLCQYMLTGELPEPVRAAPEQMELFR